MKYEKEIKQLESEKVQVKAQLDKAAAVKNQVEQSMERLVIDYNGIVKAIEILKRADKPKEGVKESGDKEKS